MKTSKAIQLARRRLVIERAVIMKKILILGGSGMLGYAVRKVLQQQGYDVHWTERNLDKTPLAEDESPNQHFYWIGEFWKEYLFQELLDAVQPDYVINCIGVIKPRMIDNFEAAIYINAIFPHMLARLCKDKTKLIHITTDCVFSGEQGPYKETAPHDALDEYGKTKSLGECSGDAMVLRTSIVGPEPYNKHSLISWVQKQQDQIVQGYTNHLWNGVTTFEFARILQQIIHKDLWKVGIYHIHSPKTINKYELVDLILRRYNITPSMFKHVEASIDCDRRLATIYPEFLTSLVIPSISYQIQSLPE